MVSQSPRKGLTQYDTADIVLAIVVSTDTPGATALAFADYIIGREQPCPWWGTTLREYRSPYSHLETFGHIAHFSFPVAKVGLTVQRKTSLRISA